MKTLKINKLLLLLVGLVVLNGCVEDDEFNIPNIAVVDLNISDPVSINSLAANLAQEQSSNDDVFPPQPLDYNNDGDVVSYSFNDDDIYLKAYVVSSDEGGNYFEELILQDEAENPTIGIKLLIDVNPLFVRYEAGRKVYIKLNGLSVGITNGLLTLGMLNGNEVDKIPSSLETEHIKRSSEIATLVPMPLAFSDFSNEKTNLYVQLQDVQFNRNEVINNSFTYAGEQLDQFDGERTLESCASASSVVFSTSTFADFKSLELPSGKGSMNAVLTKNFFGDTFNIVVNSPSDISFGGVEDRCDPDFLDCTGASGGGSAILSEDFESFSSYTAEGWDNINVSSTSTDWFISSFGGNSYSRISAYNSGNTDADVWLVTPAINMDATTGEEFSFDVQANYDNGTNLSVWVSTDYAGDPTTATWQALDAPIPSGPSGGFGSFETVGPINVSCIDGNAVFGFFYEGSDPSATTRYHVDNVEVTGN